MIENQGECRPVFFGLSLACLPADTIIVNICDALAAGRSGWILTVNLDVLRIWATDRRLREAGRGVTLTVADGMPLLWAARIARRPLPERVTGADLFVDLSRAAANAGHSIYLIGGAPGVARQAADQLQKSSPALRVLGAECPPLGFESDHEFMSALHKRLRQAQPDIVYVGLGCPKQEQVIAQLCATLPRAWWIGVGGSFNFVTGRVRRAPAWAQRHGLEWLHRLAQEPRRLFKRYLVQDLPFALRLFGAALRLRWSR
jgi:N-acetylglucosaminyldiphosphoundecaprenol N-acetyl-beta-D-mannosaminyltransferase